MDGQLGPMALCADGVAILASAGLGLSVHGGHLELMQWGPRGVAGQTPLGVGERARYRREYDIPSNLCIAPDVRIDEPASDCCEASYS